MFNQGLRSSASSEWETPRALFAKLQREFGIAFDVCATSQTAQTPAYFTPEHDALSRPWPPALVCFMNPPYGRTIGLWVAKARSESHRGVTTVCLLPARTDTKWWQSNVLNEQGQQLASEIRFLAGRLRFGGATNSAPFPSAVVVYRASVTA